MWMNIHFSFLLFLFFALYLSNFEISAEHIDQNDLEIKSIWTPKICIRNVKIGDFVRYHYYGMLENGTFFDSSYERGSSYNTYVGSGWLIEGMDMALLNMCINEHRLVSIPPHMGYGDEESDDGVIPANSTLLFNFVLLDIWSDNDTVQIDTLYKPPSCSRKIEVSDYVRYHYNGTLLNGARFHSSYDDESTYNTYVGQGWLIKGMDEGLLGSCRGERRRIVIPPHMAYGQKGDGKNIPPSSTVVFHVEIVDFHNPKDDVIVETTNGVEDCPRKLVSTDFIRYHYNGTLADGTLFDSSYERGHTYDTYVGFRRIIPGMERGLLGSCMGEWRSITFPPHLGYGERGVDGKIPGSAVLTFHVHIIDFHNPNDEVSIEVINRPDGCDGARKSEEGDYLTYDYVLKLMDGSVLESSLDQTGTWGSYIGRGNLVVGVERGLLGMCEGETRRVVVPPHIGYGEFGKEGLIPGSAVLDFTFELHKIESALPDGYQFMWMKKVGDEEMVRSMDEDLNGKVTIEEFTSFILQQVDQSNARLEPGIPREVTVVDLFKKLDVDVDESLSLEEIAVGLEPAAVRHNDEL